MVGCGETPYSVSAKEDQDVVQYSAWFHTSPTVWELGARQQAVMDGLVKQMLPKVLPRAVVPPLQFLEPVL